MSAPLVVEVSALLRHPGSRQPLRLDVALQGLQGTGGSVPAGAEVQVDLVLEAMADSIMATGDLSAPWVGECRRCLREVHGTLSAHVREVFERHPTEGETYPLSGTEIDAEPMVREAVVLELPLAPLCRPDCAGLCPDCGADRNEVDCGHRLDTADPRWAGLEELRFGDQTSD